MNPKTIIGAIVQDTRMFDRGEMREICLKYKNMRGTVKICAAIEIRSSDAMYDFIFSPQLLALFTFFEPKRMIPKVAAYESWKEIEAIQIGAKIRVNKRDSNKAYRLKLTLPLEIASAASIPIIPARTIGGCIPTKRMNPTIVVNVITIESFLPNRLVSEEMIEESKVIFIPDKTTICSSPVRLRAS